MSARICAPCSRSPRSITSHLLRTRRPAPRADRGVRGARRERHAARGAGGDQRHDRRPRAGIDAALAAIRALPGCAGLEWKESSAAEEPFKKLKVRLKREIVTMGQPQVRPAEGTGTYVDPADWNALIAAPDVVTIDTRNDYEVAIGTFEGAVNPETKSFGEFPDWWAANRDKFEGKRIAMFCTGGSGARNPRTSSRGKASMRSTTPRAGS